MRSIVTYYLDGLCAPVTVNCDESSYTVGKTRILNCHESVVVRAIEYLIARMNYFIIIVCAFKQRWRFTLRDCPIHNLPLSD